MEAEREKGISAAAATSTATDRKPLDNAPRYYGPLDVSPPPSPRTRMRNELVLQMRTAHPTHSLFVNRGELLLLLLAIVHLCCYLSLSLSFFRSLSILTTDCFSFLGLEYWHALRAQWRASSAAVSSLDVEIDSLVVSNGNNLQTLASNGTTITTNNDNNNNNDDNNNNNNNMHMDHSSNCNYFHYNDKKDSSIFKDNTDRRGDGKGDISQSSKEVTQAPEINADHIYEQLYAAVSVFISKVGFISLSSKRQNRSYLSYFFHHSKIKTAYFHHLYHCQILSAF